MSDAELWKVTPIPADLGLIDQWGEGHAVGYFPGEPITPEQLAAIAPNPFAGEVASDE